MRHICLILGVLLCTCLAVHRENFRTCNQSGFCRRHRSLQPGRSSYIVESSTLRISKTSMMVDVTNIENNVRFVLKIYGLINGMFRVKLMEAEPIRERYEIPVGFTLFAEPVEEELKYHGQRYSKLVFSLGDNRMEININPLRIDFFRDDKPLASLNALGLLRFEHTRKKRGWLSSLGYSFFSLLSQPFRETEEESKDTPQSVDGQQQAKKHSDDDGEEAGLWEETFKGFTDSKPNGPTSVGIDVSLPGFQYVYGIPEHADSFALKSTKKTDPYRLYNLDVFEYDLYSPMALYGHVPLMVAHNEKNTVGVFFHNAAEGWIDIQTGLADKSLFSNLDEKAQQTDTHWYFEDGIIDIFMLLGPGPKDVLKQYASLTGTTPLPPLWSLAYHQSRWNYKDQDDVRYVDKTMDEFDIPYDVIWLDIEHTDSKKYFTWDGIGFSNPIEMLRNLSSKGRKLVTVVDPHLKRDDNYRVYTDAKSRGLLVKNKDGKDFEGWCWPGASVWPDFLEEFVRNWWADYFYLDVYKGSAENLFIWNDMNEPSVFDSPELTFPKDVKHLSGRENREVHNVYGMLVHRATFDGLFKRSDYRERPFVLARSFFAGSQRYSAIWTGDGKAEWSHLRITVPMLLSLSLAGIHFSGADVGGFFNSPENELLTRWYQAAAFQPFFRAHAHIDSKRREPYLLPEENMIIIREAIKKRYTYLPYLYNLFHESENTGVPPMRALWLEYPEDTKVFPMDDEYLLGDALLVKPLFNQGQKSTIVYFPGTDTIWYDVDNFKPYHGQHEVKVDAPLSKLPLFQKGGTIIPRKMRVRRASSLMSKDPFTLYVCLDKQGSAEGYIYVDDYHTLDHKSGSIVKVSLTFHNNRLEGIRLHRGRNFTTKEWIERVIIVGTNRQPKYVHLTVGDRTVELEHSYNSVARVLTVRKPAVNVCEEKWTISIH